LRTSASFVVLLSALSGACNGSIYHPSGAPRLSASRFLAFGDSMTEGVVSSCPANASTLTLTQLMFTLPASPGASWTYPAVLQSRLRDTFITQQPTVANRGVGGEALTFGSPTGVTRLPGVLIEERPEVALLFEGANDVNNGVAPAAIAAALTTMMQQARGRGAQVFVATLLPQRPRGTGGSCRGFGASGIPAANDAIRSAVRTGGATLVDLYEAFHGSPDPYIGPDGLHPTEAGYGAIADTFFHAIEARLRD
jgi:lysophospholipase L1-like esterase